MAVKVNNSKLSIVADEVHIMGVGKGKPYSVATFLVKNDSDATIEVLRCELHDKEHDLFWKRFVSGKSLYDMVAEKYSLPLNINDAIEKEFINHELVTLEVIDSPKQNIFKKWLNALAFVFSKLWRHN